MATEYYIVKPDKKQKFYLGRRISYLDGIPCWRHTQEARFPEWECWEDVVSDIQENARYFLESDLRVGQVWDFCSAIYEFCDDKVYLDDDCNDENTEWSDYEEIDVFSDILTTEETWCSLIELIPKERWIVEGNTILEYETVKNYLLEQYNKTRTKVLEIGE